MTVLQLGVPIEVAGQEIVILRDVIGTEARTISSEQEVFTVIEPRAEDGRPPIYINENELKNMRVSYPGIHVYGLWQILFANELVPLGSGEVIVLPTSSDSGHFLRMAPESDFENPANIHSSSEFIGNFLHELVDYDLINAGKISVDIAAIRLPLTPAFTRNELYDKQKHEQRNRWFVVASVCLTILAGVGIYNYTLQSIFNINKAEYETKKQQRNDLGLRKATLLKERLRVLPDDSVVIGRLESLLQYDPTLRTSTGKSEANFSEGIHKLITRPSYPGDLALKVEGVTSALNSKLEYELTVTAGPDKGNEN